MNHDTKRVLKSIEFENLRNKTMGILDDRGPYLTELSLRLEAETDKHDKSSAIRKKIRKPKRRIRRLKAEIRETYYI